MKKKLVIKALRKYIKTIAFDASLYEHGLVSTSHAKRCFEERRDLLLAISEIEDKNLSLSPLTTKDGVG